jgi:hypothetical protein
LLDSSWFVVKVVTSILHHFYEQAFRPVPQRVNFLVGVGLSILPQDACSTKIKFSCGVGILPAPERLIENGAI